MKLKVKLVGSGWDLRVIPTGFQEVTVRSILLKDGSSWELIDGMYDIELADEVKINTENEQRLHALDIFGQQPKKITFDF